MSYIRNEKVERVLVKQREKYEQDITHEKQYSKK